MDQRAAVGEWMIEVLQRPPFVNDPRALRSRSGPISKVLDSFGLDLIDRTIRSPASPDSRVGWTAVRMPPIPGFVAALDRWVTSGKGPGLRGRIGGKGGWHLEVDRITESRGEMHGELTVIRSPEGHLMRQRINLTSSTARTSPARLLSCRSNHVEWGEVLERFCMQVVDAQRTPARRAPG